MAGVYTCGHADTPCIIMLCRYAATPLEAERLSAELLCCQPDMLGLCSKWTPDRSPDSPGPTALLQLCYYSKVGLACLLALVTCAAVLLQQRGFGHNNNVLARVICAAVLLHQGGAWRLPCFLQL